MIWPRIRRRLERKHIVDWNSRRANSIEAYNFIRNYLTENPNATEDQFKQAAIAGLSNSTTLYLAILFFSLAIELWRLWRSE